MSEIIAFFRDIEFANVQILWLLLFIPIAIAWYILKMYKSRAS